MPEARNPIEGFIYALYNMIDRPVTYFREKIIEPNQQHYPWYHQKYRRVPTVDQCYTDDYVCKFEADQQYARDRMVDDEILCILRSRAEDCRHYNDPDRQLCDELQQIYEDAATNYFSKHGDIGPGQDSKQVYFKQKHRMVWERRHGPIGSGMKNQEKE